MKRTRQPQYPARIDWSNPLTLGLRHVYDAWRHPEYSNSGVGYAVTDKGLAGSFVAASSNYLSAPTAVNVPMTFWSLHRLSSININQSIIAAGGSTNNRALLYYSSTNKLCAFVNGTVGTQAISGVIAEVGKWHTAEASFVASGYRSVYFDGVYQAEDPTTDAIAAPTILAIGANYTTTPSLYLNGQQALGLVWNRLLTAPERIELQRNPWQIYAPTRRIWVQLGAATTGGTGTTVAPSKGALTITGYTPGIVQPHAVAPTAGHVVITGKQPTVAQPRVVAPAKGALVVTGYAPGLVKPQTLAPTVGHLTAAGYAPGISQSASGTIAPSVGHLTVTGYAPGIEQDIGVAPAVGHLTLTGYAPGIVQNVTTFIAPSKGALTITGKQPSIASTANKAIAPTQGTLQLAGYAPVLAQTGAQIIGPLKGALTLAGYAPTVQVIGAGVTVVEPSAGALTLAGYAPLIGLLLAADAQDSSRLIDRDPARIGSSRIGPPAVNRDDYPFGTPAPSRRLPRLG